MCMLCEIMEKNILEPPDELKELMKKALETKAEIETKLKALDNEAMAMNVILNLIAEMAVDYNAPYFDIIHSLEQAIQGKIRHYIEDVRDEMKSKEQKQKEKDDINSSVLNNIPIGDLKIV